MTDQRNSPDGVRRGWRSAPICDDCWVIENGERQPVRLNAVKREACYRCGKLTTSGIYVRRES